MGDSECSRQQMEGGIVREGCARSDPGMKDSDGRTDSAGQSKIAGAGTKRLRDSSALARPSPGTPMPDEMGELQVLLHSTQERSDQYHARAMKLHSLLMDREREVAQLQQQVLQLKRSPSLSPAMSEQDVKQAYCNSVQALKDYVALSSLLSYDISGTTLPEKIIVDLKMQIHQISKVCLQVMKPETPIVLELISKDFNLATVTDWELDKSHWINVIAQLQLTDQQALTILKSREQHVATMMSLYQERAVLCRQAGEMATKSSSTVPGLSSTDDNSNMGVLMRHGYLYCARNVVALHRVLELVKENMQKEQRAIMELFLQVVYQILSPIQAALFVIESFPYHCDVLALANILSMVFGRGTGGADMGLAGPDAGSMKQGPMGVLRRSGSSPMPDRNGSGLSGPGMGSGLHLGAGSGSGGSGRLGVPPVDSGNAYPMPGRLNSSPHGQQDMHPNITGGDADMMASWLQMQGCADPLDPHLTSGGGEGRASPLANSRDWQGPSGSLGGGGPSSGTAARGGHPGLDPASLAGSADLFDKSSLGCAVAGNNRSWPGGNFVGEDPERLRSGPGMGASSSTSGGGLMQQPMGAQNSGGQHQAHNQGHNQAHTMGGQNSGGQPQAHNVGLTMGGQNSGGQLQAHNQAHNMGLTMGGQNSGSQHQAHNQAHNMGLNQGHHPMHSQSQSQGHLQSQSQAHLQSQMMHQMQHAGKISLSSAPWSLGGGFGGGMGRQTSMDARQPSLGMDGRQASLGMEGRQVPLGTDGRHASLGMEGRQVPLGMDGRHASLGMDARQPSLGMDGRHASLGMEGRQVPLGMEGQGKQGHNMVGGMGMMHGMAKSGSGQVGPLGQGMMGQLQGGGLGLGLPGSGGSSGRPGGMPNGSGLTDQQSSLSPGFGVGAGRMPLKPSGQMPGLDLSVPPPGSKIR